MIEYYPVFLNPQRGNLHSYWWWKSCRKKGLSSLLKTGAKVKVIPPNLTPKLQELFEKGKIIWENRTYKKGDLDKAFLVIAATNDPLIQEEIFKEAQEKNIPCNVVDKPEYCTFIVPSTINRGDLIIAISTSGASPAIARRLREILEESFGKEYEIYLKLMRKIREKVLKMELSPEEKEEKLQKLALSALPVYLRYGDLDLIKIILEKEGFSEIIPEVFFPDKASKDT